MKLFKFNYNIILIYLITFQNLKKLNLMLGGFQETFQSLLNHYQ